MSPACTFSNELLSWLGEFLKSPGVGGVTALIAAGIVYVTAQQRMRHERQEARESRLKDQEAAMKRDAADRWWQAVTWLHENRDKIPPTGWANSLSELALLVTTDAQRVMIQALGEEEQAKDDSEDVNFGYAEPTEGA